MTTTEATWSTPCGIDAPWAKPHAVGEGGAGVQRLRDRHRFEALLDGLLAVIAENAASVLWVRVVWFRYGFAIPIDPYVLSQLAVFEWKTHAVGWWP